MRTDLPLDWGWLEYEAVDLGTAIEELRRLDQFWPIELRRVRRNCLNRQLDVRLEPVRQTAGVIPPSATRLSPQAPPMHRPFLAILFSLIPAAVCAAEDHKLTLERDVRPILKAHCLDCHGGAKELKGDLDLRLARFMIAGGESGPAIAVGKPDKSLLIQRIRNGEMPPTDKVVPAAQVTVLEKWIAAGAPTARPEPETIEDGIGITAEEREFWSFKPVFRPEVPKFADADRVRTPIDAILLQRMKDKASGLSFSPDADKRTMIRRLYLDLIGLPPKPDEVAAFLADTSPEAYDHLVDHLLDSPHYGERWARHWLDIAGYADSEGYTNADADRPWAYQYRDYVIRSLNADKPYDQFIQEQLAGDEMIPQPHKNLSPDQIEKLTATGLLRMAADGTGSGSNDDVARNQTMGDTIKIISTSLLGLSVGCAQCHDHRYDPIPQKDYFALRAVFEPALNWKRWRTPQQRLISLYTDADRAKASEVEAEAKIVAAEKSKKQTRYIDEALEKELTKHPAELRDQLKSAYKTPGAKRNDQQKRLLKEYPSVNISSGNLYQYNKGHADELKAYDTQIAKIRTKKPVEKFLRALTESPGEAPQTFLFHRGDYRQPTEVIEPAALSIAAPPGQRATFGKKKGEGNKDGAQPTTGRRLAYAKSLTSGEHPLVARVLVNRIWLHHFGRGIVGTPADFGVLGERPTHPELLDWLASEFVAQKWSLKKLHKLIVTSTVYRQSSVASQDKLVIDGANSYYWKWPLQRLDAEIVRDRILATSGVLGEEMYGAAVNVKTDDAGQVLVDGGETRRSIYIRVKRTQPVAMLKAFDAPVMAVNCETRPSSTVAPQALFLMNSEFILRQARILAERVKTEAKTPVHTDFDLARLQAGESNWQFGYGHLEPNGSVANFTPLPHWTGNTWQGGAKLPDAKLSYSFLNATGGHPSDKMAVIRRWTATQAGTLVIGGQLGHPSKNGDGVRGSVVSNRLGVVGQWVAQGGGVATKVDSVAIEQGDHLDFVVDCRTNMNSDSFSWEVDLALSTSGGKMLTANSKTAFHGPVADVSLTPAQIVQVWRLAYCRPPSDSELTASLQFLADQVEYLKKTNLAESKNPHLLQAMANLCQILLSSNEFLYTE